MAIDSKAAKLFAAQWAGQGYEKGQSQKFWTLLLHEVLRYSQMHSVLFEHRVGGGGYIDVWIRDAGVMIEQKSLGVDLDQPELRQGRLKTPLQQVMDYAEDLPISEQPRYLITCNFGLFRVYDRASVSKSELAKAPTIEFTLEELGEHPEYLGFILDPNNSRLEKEKKVSIKAGEMIGQLYDLLREQYFEPDSPETRHDLNVLCVRLVFCLFCEDAGLFEKDGFYRYLQEVSPGQIRPCLKRLFKALDTPIEQRDRYDESIRSFPYVNGGLFREETEIPPFTAEMKELLLSQVSRAVDWSQISPTIFGGIFESTLNPETRRQSGMHYTSPENIHKVIDPLFLDELTADFEIIKNELGLTPRQRINRYQNFHRKLCSLKFFDPACGSGNFLTETYLQLRSLEDRVLRELRAGQTSLALDMEEDAGMRVSLGQFYGIEINDFAVKVAEVALWISRLKANGETYMMLSLEDNDFPIKENPQIICGNALTMDWGQVLPPAQCSYLLGNPPFIGYSRLDSAQKQERLMIFGKNGGVLDYVACWYRKAADYMRDNRNIEAAFVSTNSICQGQQVSPLWKELFAEGVVINFAHRTFIWSNEASDQAHVYCVIVGFSYSGKKKQVKSVWNYRRIREDKDVSVADLSEVPLSQRQVGERQQVAHLNGYLMDAPDVFIDKRNKPLCDIPAMSYGNKPTDKGNLIVSDEEKEDFLKKEPKAEKWLRPFVTAKEFLSGKPRWCLWLKDCPPSEMVQMPTVMERVQKVKEMRLASPKVATRKKAQTPWLFDEIRDVGEGSYIVIPLHTGERRKYVPLGFLDSSTIPGNSVSIVPDADLYMFGVLTSQMHNAWMRIVAGRIKSDYRYSSDIVYNNFIWPQPSAVQRKVIENTAQGILAARAAYPDASLATLYDPNLMPADLRAAHRENDQAVEAAYGIEFAGDEEKIVAHLFSLYAQKTVTAE